MVESSRPSSVASEVTRSLGEERHRSERRQLNKIRKRVIAQTSVQARQPLAGNGSSNGNADGNGGSSRSSSLPHLQLAPRSYQAELFERAKQRNIIVCLETGSGKTLISALLLQHVHDSQPPVYAQPQPINPAHVEEQVSDLRPSRRPLRTRKVSFFLVNLVPLVHQQASVIASNTSLRVGKLYGELKDEILDSKSSVDTWRLPEWDTLMDAHDVIVATAQCLLDALIHGYIHMSEINLIVFDEVHHAIKSHPYARIMLYYRLVDAPLHPKILGMTASPLFSIDQTFTEASNMLQQMMDAEILTANRQNQDDLQSVVNRPIELVVEYEAPNPTVVPTQLSVRVAEACRHISEEFDKTVWPKIEYALLNHGSLMADLVWIGSTQEFYAKAQRFDESVREARTQHNLLSTGWTSRAAYQELIGDEIKLAHLCSHPDLNRAILSVLKDQPLPPSRFEIGLDNCSAKVLKLVDILKCYGVCEESKQALCGIVFVQRRQTACALAEFLKRIPCLDFVHPEWIVGHDNSNGPAMDWHDQVQVLSRFRQRNPTNLLIATSVAEEGIDIQAANLVIRFDLFTRHISFLQSRGRARSQNSRYIIMAEKDNPEHLQTITSAVNTEMGRLDWLDSQSGNDTHASVALPQVEDDELGYDFFFDSEQTGARLYPQDAPNLVNHYTAYLHTEDFPTPSPNFHIDVIDRHFSRSFVCRLELPANSAVREVVSHPWPSKKSAKRMAAFEACRQLREMDALDEHLMPRAPYRPSADSDRVHSSAANAIAALERRAARVLHLPLKDLNGWEQMPFIPVPAFNKESGYRLYATLLPFDRLNQHSNRILHQPLVLVTAEPLPATSLLSFYFGPDEASIGCTEGSHPIVLTAEQLEVSRAFTIEILNWASKRSWSCDDQLAVVALPVQSCIGLSVDWATVERVCSQQAAEIDLANDSSLQEVMLMESRQVNMAGCYSIQTVRHDVNPYSRPEPGSKEERKGCESYFAFYRDVVKSHVKVEIEAPSPDQPILVCRKIEKARNLLSSRETASSRSLTDYMLIPSLYRASPIPLSLARSALLLPSVLYRYDDLLLTQHCNRTLFSNRVNNDLLLQALTSSALRTSYSYERLEFYGDTFLKLLASCYTFTTRHYQSESELTLANKEMIINAKLFQDAMRLGLWSYLQASPKWMSIKRFYPPRLRRETQVSGIEGRVKTVPVEPVPTPEVTAMDVDEDEAKSRNGAPHRSDAADEPAPSEYSVEPTLAGDVPSKPVGEPVDAEEDEPPTHIYVSPVTEDTPAAEQDAVGEKTLSDLIESILGASLWSAGPDEAIRISQVLGVLPSSINRMADFAVQFQAMDQRALAEDWSSRVDMQALDHLEKKFGYRFRMPHLALEAFTHPSLLASVLPSYQRLEFLGDSLLDYYVVSYLVRTYPDLNEGQLTTIKGNMVSNSTLSALSEVLELAPFISSHSQVLNERVSEHTRELRALRIAAESQPDPVQYWWSLTAPKATADVVESSLGAIVVDANFDLAAGQRVFDDHILPFLSMYCTPERAVVPNTRLLARLLVPCSQWSVQIEYVTPDLQPAQPDEPAAAAHCRVWFHGILVAQIATRLRSHAQREAVRRTAAAARVDTDLFHALVKAIKWARPFMPSKDVPAIADAHPLRLATLATCTCTRKKGVGK